MHVLYAISTPCGNFLVRRIVFPTDTLSSERALVI
jgi:hypothetical protein